MVADFLGPLQELRQWRNIAFCLAQLGMGERGLRRMADLLRCYKAALHDGEVLACLQVGLAHFCTVGQHRDDWPAPMGGVPAGSNNAVCSG